MRIATLTSVGLCSVLAAQAPAPVVKWRGSIWGSLVTSNRDTADGSVFLRPCEGTNGQFNLDGLQLGADVALSDGWSLKATLLGGRMGKLLNDANGEPGPVALPEATLTWTGEKDTFRVGRMNTWLGMEFVDHTQDLAGSRGPLFTFAIPFVQVGLNWHHSFTTNWSSDLWVLNGEDRVRDNNQGKTWGLGINYNHGGAADKFLSLGAYRGPEQTSLGEQAVPGAEGRARERFFLNGQWVWGNLTLQGEAEYAREPFPAESLGGRPGEPEAQATWLGMGLIARYQVQKSWAAFAHLETLRDSTGVRLAGDTTVAGLFQAGTLGRRGLGLQASSGALGLERSWEKTFSRLEVRMDRLNDGVGTDCLRSALSVTWSFGTSF